MTHVSNKPVIKVTVPTEDEKFYIQWGREILKNNLVFTNDVLRQLITLNTALLGSSIAFLDERIIDLTLKKFIILFFLLSLIFSFIGVMPYGNSIDLRMPEEIKKYKETAFKWKRYCLWAASSLLAFGFLIALIGLVIHKP